MHPDTAGSASAFRRPECGALSGGATLTDRLSLTNVLADANIDRRVAERIATEIFDAIHEHVATKADLQQLEQRMLLRMAELEHRLTVRFASVMVVLTGVILAAIRYLPPAPHG